MKTKFTVRLVISLFVITLFTAALNAQFLVPDNLLAGLRWRNIGPFHGGRISAVTGAIGQAGVFYVGAPEGGVWKTTNAGVTWVPIFDEFTNVDSIGSVQVAPSDPNIVYVGTGDSVGGSLGDGMYRSSDAGKTWTHIGLDETTKINKMVVDPKDPNIVIVSTQGDAKRSGAGIYRTTDGGKTWTNVLKPENANGTRDVEYAFDNPNVVFATSQSIGGGFGGGTPPANPPPNGTALYRSTDEGKTWTKVETLPALTGRISVAVAMHTDGKRVYVIGNGSQGGSGLYRSDDQGATWQSMAADDNRITNGQGGYSSGVWVDTQNPDIVYMIATTIYRSTDGGKTFSAFKGAPGGEDPQCGWIDPTDGQRMLFGFDQGPAVTLDGGQTWSGYYQIPIDQIYHVATDNRYPYWVMGSQQDTGAIMTRSRSDWGQVTFVDWLPLPSSEFGTVMPDPLKPTTVYGVGYGAGQGNGLIKIDLETGQWGNVAPNFGANRPLYGEAFEFWKRFDTAFEPKALYVGYNCLMVTRDGAQTWTPFSPDLTTTKDQPMVPCGVAPPATPTPGPGGGRFFGPPSITDFAISTVMPGVVWSGSSSGQIYNTMDGGKTWNNVTNFPDLPANANFVTVEAGHNDVNTAYVVANVGFGRGAPAPSPEQHYIYRTHDAGKTWSRIGMGLMGLPVDERTGSQVHVIREDPKQPGLLFAGTDTTVYVSFNDGNLWQSLRLNLPSTSIRDMVFHTDDHMNDLVIGTYGRGFWVLDDMSPLRDIAARQIGTVPAYLFKPGDAIRSRQNANWDQPMNTEIPHAPNPPFGAIIYYYLSKPPAGEVRLQVFDADGKLVRTMSSIQPKPYERPPFPEYWLMSPEERSLPTRADTINRTNWDLRYDDPPGFDPDINNQMNSVPDQVTPAPHGPLVLPGTYTVKLLVDGATYTQTLIVHNDPRVGESPDVMSALRAQNQLALASGRGMRDSYGANQKVAVVRAQLAALNLPPPDVATAATALDTKLATIGGVMPRFGRGGGGRGREQGSVRPFYAINGIFETVLGPLSQNGLDMPPNKAAIDTWELGCKEFTATAKAWKTMVDVDLVAFNTLLASNKLDPLNLASAALSLPPSCTFSQ